MATPNLKAVKGDQSRLLGIVFDRVKSVRTPVQLISFLLAIAFAIVMFQLSPAANLLAFVILLLPFILLVLVVNKKILETLSGGGYVLLIIASLIIIGSFIMSAYVAIALVRSSQEGLVQTSSNALLQPAKKAKVQDIKDANFRLTNYLDSYKLISGYYYQALMECFNPRNTKDPYSTVALLRKELDTLIIKIISVRSSELNDMYGQEEINKRVLKLQESILALDSTRYFWDVVLRIYSEEGKTYKIDDIIDTKGWNLSESEMTEVKRVDFSGIEADLIRALGRDIVVKPVNGFQSQDVDSIRNSLRSLGYLADSSDSLNTTEILNKYKGSIAAYYSPQDQNQPFYKLAGGGVEDQIPIYLALYDTGLLDFKKFFLKYSPVKSHQILLELMERRISLFDVDDLNKLTEAILQQKTSVRSAREQSNTVLFKIRDGMKERLSGSAEVQAVLSSATVEEYFTKSLRLFVRKAKNPEEGDLFVGIHSFVFLGQTEVTSAYGQMLQEMLSYYNVFETDLMIGALDQ